MTRVTDLKAGCEYGVIKGVPRQLPAELKKGKNKGEREREREREREAGMYTHQKQRRAFTHKRLDGVLPSGMDPLKHTCCPRRESYVALLLVLLCS